MKIITENWNQTENIIGILNLQKEIRGNGNGKPNLEIQRKWEGKCRNLRRALKVTI
jgi:hypothetical protein